MKPPGDEAKEMRGVGNVALRIKGELYDVGLQLGDLDVIIPRIFVTDDQAYTFSMGNNLFNRSNVVRGH